MAHGARAKYTKRDSTLGGYSDRLHTPVPNTKSSLRSSNRGGEGLWAKSLNPTRVPKFVMHCCYCDIVLDFPDGVGEHFHRQL